MGGNNTTWGDGKTAVEVVKSGNRVYLDGRSSTPTALIEALVARGEALQGVRLLATRPFGPVADADPRAVGQQPPNQIQREIGGHVGELIEDGATLQLGIGAIPDAILQDVTDRRDLGIHSEMFSDGVLDLVERGVIPGARKALDRGKMVASFLIGSRRLMDFLDDNPMVELRSISYTNDIEVIRQFDHMVAINSALEVDLTGQVCAESIGTAQYSGVGGQIDFLQGAADAPHGRPVLACAATAPTSQDRAGNIPYELTSMDGQVSRIVPTLTPGAVVTTTRAHVHYVATEYGRVT